MSTAVICLSEVSTLGRPCRRQLSLLVKVAGHYRQSRQDPFKSTSNASLNNWLSAASNYCISTTTPRLKLQPQAINSYTEEMGEASL